MERRNIWIIEMLSSIQHCKVLRLGNKQANKKKNLIGFQELNPLIS